MTGLAPLVAVAAARPPDEKVTPGIAGFLAIFALAVATVLLIRSMVGHLRKVRYGPGPDGEPAPDLPAGAPGRTPPGAPAPDVTGPGVTARGAGAEERPPTGGTGSS